MAVEHLLIFGLGYSGTALARAAAQAGLQVCVATRQPAGAVAPPGVRLVPFETPPLDSATLLVATAPPGQAGDPVLAQHGAAIARAPRLRWVGYLSTTGVYGDCGGAWVDESSTPATTSERGQRRVAAERGWAEVRPGTAVDLVRLAGIYGPGRSVLDDVRAGRARRVDKPGHKFGRIHRDDIVGGLLAAMARPGGAGPRTLNFADDEPAESADVIEQAAILLGLEPPPLTPFATAWAEMSPMARGFWSESRQVRSQVTQTSLGRRWRYPSYREGLRAILAAEPGADGVDVPGSDV